MVNNWNYKKIENGFREFTQELKDDTIGSVLFFYGQERFLFKWAVDSLVQKYVTKGFEQLDYVKLDDIENTSIIIENAENSSMISPKRVIWVDNYKALLDEKIKGYAGTEIEALKEYISSYSGNNILIFTFDESSEKAGKIKALDGKCYNFDKLDPGALNSFVKKRMNAAGKSISKDQLDFLIDLSGYYNRESDYRLLDLENDIKKIIAHSEGDAIRTSDIEISMNGDLNTYVFDFIEALSYGQKDKAFSLMNNLINAGSNFFQLLALIENQFELMLEIMELENDGMNFTEIVKSLGVHEFRVKKAHKAAKKFTLKRLKTMLISLYEIEKNVKNGNIDQRIALELFAAKI